MASEVAPPALLPRLYQTGVISRSSMAALMQSSNDPTSITNPLSAVSSSVVSNPSESIIFLKQQPNSETSLSSIASAGLHVSRSSRDQLPQMNPSKPTGPTDRPLEHEHDSQQRSSQVAREALGASEKSHTGVINDTMHMPPDHMQVDPHAGSGNVTETFGTTENSTTSLVNTSTVASPGPIEDTVSQDGDRPHHRDDGEIPQEHTSKSFSYPLPTPSMSDPRRGHSLPNSGFHKGSLRSPSAKKHRCPYCPTEFTRHHNLKSHLLTHSQEKPFVCQTCQSRFRRHHDLKRHMKLHTGERPHICPKCGRRFARGDALARHNKGQGGCAGRRSSMGSFIPEDEYGDNTAHGGPEDGMEGLVYAEPERMDEDDERRLSMPSIKTHGAPTEHYHRSITSVYQPRQPSTYPPIATSRPSPGGLFPPAASHGGSSTSTSPISQTGNLNFPPPGQPSGASIFPSNVTESPKSLSPNTLTSHQLGHVSENNMQLHRGHSPGMAQSYQQQTLGRTGAIPTQPSLANPAAPGLGLPPPQPGAPQLPPPPGLSPSDSRFSLPNQAPVQPSSSGPPQQTSSHSLSRNHSISVSSKTEAPQQTNSSYFAGPHDPNLTDQGQEDKLWAYIRSVHEELTGLKTEVAALRAQIASSNMNSSATDPHTGKSQSETGATNAGQR